MISTGSLLALCLSFLFLPTDLLTPYILPTFMIVVMTSYIKKLLLRRVKKVDITAVHHGDPIEAQKNVCFINKLDATSGVGCILQKLFYLLSTCVLYSVLLILDITPVAGRQLKESTVGNVGNESGNMTEDLAPQKAEFTKHGAFVKAGVAMAMTVLANATTHIKDIVEDATVSKMQALTPAKVEQFAKPIQFHWADEEVEGQEVIPVALINTEFANNGAFLKAAAAMGEAKLETVGHVDNEIVEDVPKKQILTPTQAELLKPIQFCWADEEFGGDLVVTPIPTDKVVEEAVVTKKQSLSPAQKELLRLTEFSWADEEFDDNSSAPVASIEEVTKDGPKEQALTAAEVEELLKPTEFSWADEDFEGTPTDSTKKIIQVKGCNGDIAWCPTRKQLEKSGLSADDGFTLHDQMGGTEVGGPLYVCHERLLCLYRPREFQQQKLFGSKVEEIQEGADCLKYVQWLQKRGEALVG